MRRLVPAALVALLAIVASGCASAGASKDPYQLAYQARAATWDQVQIDFSMSAHMGTTDVRLDPGAIRLVVDTKAHKGLFHMSLPATAIGPAASALPALGVTGATLDLDVLFDGTSLYAKSPLAPALVKAAFANSTSMPTGDLTGWLQLVSPSDLATLAALVPTASASAAPEATFTDAASLKAYLAKRGATLTLVGTEQHAGVNADHLSVTIDWDVLSANLPTMPGMSLAQMQSNLGMLKSYNPTIDLWLDHASNRFIGFKLKGASQRDATQTFDVTMSLKAPEAGISLDTPSSSVSVPIVKLVLPMLQRSMGSMMPSGMGSMAQGMLAALLP